jgi:hypothetical protein
MKNLPLDFRNCPRIMRTTSCLPSGSITYLINTTIVWFAHTEPAPQGSTLKLTDDGKLVLYDLKDVK